MLGRGPGEALRGRRGQPRSLGSQVPRDTQSSAEMEQAQGLLLARGCLCTRGGGCPCSVSGRHRALCYSCCGVGACHTPSEMDLSREIRNVELLKLRFGEAPMHFCEVMLKVGTQGALPTWPSLPQPGPGALETPISPPGHGRFPSHQCQHP